MKKQNAKAHRIEKMIWVKNIKKKNLRQVYPEQKQSTAKEMKNTIMKLITMNSKKIKKKFSSVKSSPF